MSCSVAIFNTHPIFSCILISMSKEETIDGARVAAQILSCLPSEDREQLLESIKITSPSSAAKIQENLFNFEQITELNDHTVQKLLREVAHRDVVISLKSAPQPVRAKILHNMSESRQRLIEDDFENLPPMRSSDVQAAQQRILKRLDELYPDTINTPSPKPFLPRLA